MQTMTIRGITAFTMFVVVGPPIGSALFVAPMLVQGDLVPVIIAIPFSYLFGLPPAILAGALYLLGYRLIGHSTNARVFSVCLGTLAGLLAAISVLAPAVMFDIAGTKDFMSGIFGIVFTVSGVFSGAVCGLISNRILASTRVL